MASDPRRRASGLPGRSLSLVPTLTTDKKESGAGGLGGARSENRVLINVGGVRYETYKSTLKNIPDTRLSWITESTAHNSDYDPDTGEYFFDRHPGVFNMVLNYYRTGRLHAPVDVCGPLFEEELAFWGIDEKQIEACCWMNYRTHRDAQETLAEIDGGDDNGEDDDELDLIAARFGIHQEDRPTPSLWDTWQPRIWSLLEEPYSSKGAQVVAAISIMFVLLSISVFILESHMLFRRPYNSSVVIDDTWKVDRINAETYADPVLDVLDYVCVAYFTLEFLSRFIFCPRKLHFFKSALNWVDLLSVLPFYIEKIIVGTSPHLLNPGTIKFFKTIRLVRIFRIFKLTRHFSGLKILGHTIRASAKEMLLLVMFLVISILIFACLIYLAETAEEHDLNYFKDIPIGLWWACVTMTTLGYGDIYPRTGLGYVVGAICAVAGVLVLALPVPVIVNNFALYYSHAQARLKLPKKRRRILVGAPDMLKTQMGMPGDSLVESGQAPSPTGSERSASSKRKPGAESVNSVGSVDSGIKTGESQDSGGSGGSRSSGGISVIFTDETSVCDTPPETTVRTECQPRSQASGRSLSLEVPGEGPGGGFARRGGGGGGGKGSQVRSADNRGDTSDGVAISVSILTVEDSHGTERRDSSSSQRRASLRPHEAPRRRRSLMPPQPMSEVDP